MKSSNETFASELESLVERGRTLHAAMQYECHKEQVEKAYKKALGDKSEEALKALPSFSSEYQNWYSISLAVVRQLLPDRVDDFRSFYEYPRVRKEISHGNYRIRDYLQGLIRKQWDGEIIVGRNSALAEFEQQLQIVRAAKESLQSKLIDLRTLLQADLFDSEIDAAASLARSGHLRASGALCGVVIEKHLAEVATQHGTSPRKKNPSINDYNQLLRDADVLDIPMWRFIQHLADIRNVCDHAKGREPTKSEIDGLVDGTRRVIKTVL